MRLTPTDAASPSQISEPEKRFGWGKFFYLAVLLILALAAIRGGIQYFGSIRAPGILEGKKIALEAPLSAKIEKIAIQIGDKVTAGQELIFLDTQELQNQIKQQESELKALNAACESEQKFLPLLLEEKNQELLLRQNAIQQNQQRLQGEIKQLQLKLSQLNNKLADQRRLLAESRQLLKLNAITRFKQQAIKRKAQELEDEVPSANLRLQNQQQELVHIQQTLRLLKQNQGLLSKQIQGKSRLPFLKAKLAAATQQLNLLQAAFKERIISSPMAGIITQTFKLPGEIVMTGEAIAELVDPDSVCVKAFFDPKHQPQLKEGNIVRLLFDNQVKSWGKISKFYPATTPLPPQFQQVYEPHKRALIVEIQPLNRQEWPLTIDMGVMVQQQRWP